MAKVSKRQRKFLSKKVLPHKKKLGRRQSNEPKGAAGASKGDAKKDASSSSTPQERKTLPHGVDVSAFLECVWLDPDVCAAADRDKCVEILEQDSPCLRQAEHETSVPSSGNLSEETARGIIARAVDEGSESHLILAVWALRQSFDSSLDDANPRARLHAEAGSTAQETLRRDGFGRLHLAFLAHLRPDRECEQSVEEWEDSTLGHRQLLEKAEAWTRLGPVLLAFLTTALEYVNGLTLAGPAPHQKTADNQAEGQTRKHLLEGLERMRKHIPFLFPFPRLARRYLVLLLNILDEQDDHAIVSGASVRLYELATSQPMPFLHDAFKGAYRSYRGAAERIGARAGRIGNYGTASSRSGSLPLLRLFLAELFGVEKPSAYLHAYTYVHELVREALAAADEVRLRGGKMREAGPALRRLRSWSFLQSLQLWVAVVTAHPSKASLGALLPPLAKALDIAFQLSPGLHGAPRTLALARGAQDLAAATGVFLPTSQYLVGLLELLHVHEGRAPSAALAFSLGVDAGEGAVIVSRADGSSAQVGTGKSVLATSGDKKASSGKSKETVDLTGFAGLGKEDLRLGPVQAAISKAAAGLIAREAVCYRWSAGLPELCAVLQARLQKLLDGGCLPSEGGAGKCRAAIKSAHAALARSATEAASRRGRSSKHPGEAGLIDTFRSPDEATASERLHLFKDFA